MIAGDILLAAARLFVGHGSVLAGGHVREDAENGVANLISLQYRTSSEQCERVHILDIQYQPDAAALTLLFYNFFSYEHSFPITRSEKKRIKK